jgi:sugar/nucleoside kinase (ribokinase family)
MKNILTIGGATHDIFIITEQGEIGCEEKKGCTFLLFEEGCKIEVKKLHHATGGGCTNAAASLQLLGHQVTAVCKIARDSAGEHVSADLKKRGVSTEHLIITSQAPTGTSFILPSPTGNRVILAYRGANTTLTTADIPLDVLAKSNGVYITSLSGQSAYVLPFITQNARKHNVTVVVNPGKGQLRNGAAALQESLPTIDIFILNEREAGILFAELQPKKTFSLDDYFEEILQRGPKIVVVTCGPQGVHVATKEKRYFREPFPVAHITNTVGAGDAFGSCFFGMLMHGYAIEEALRFGMLNSASLLSGQDSKEKLLTKEKLEKLTI